MVRLYFGDHHIGSGRVGSLSTWPRTANATTSPAGVNGEPENQSRGHLLADGDRLALRVEGGIDAQDTLCTHGLSGITGVHEPPLLREVSW
jgi:hypothetical protein